MKPRYHKLGSAMKLSLSLLLAMAFLPVAAFASPQGESRENGAAAQSASREIAIKNETTSEEVKLAPGDEVSFVFDLHQTTLAGFTLCQSEISSTDHSLFVTLEQPGKDNILWSIDSKRPECSLNPFFLSAGTHRLKISSSDSVTITVKPKFSDLDEDDTIYEHEPNDVPQDAVPLEFEKTHIGVIYHPMLENYPSGSGSQSGEGDLDVYSFTLESPVEAIMLIVVDAKLDYMLMKDGNRLKAGKTKGSSNRNIYDWGRLEPGTYDLHIIGDSSAWKESYALCVTANAIDKPATPDEPGNSDEPTASVDRISMFRLYNPNSGEHFYTASETERDAVVASGWNDEGIGWTAPSSGIQVYRLYNAVGGEHHYTTDAGERDALVAAGWTWEDGGWFSDENESVPLYRAYNPNAFANNHNYTADANEHATLLGLGWVDEGIGWHGIG